ncbi:hypothetical protein F5888DRAFT_637016 [Russula emetica]|nr:hypothetical protein F5888DRAFT_637016 [Russula emetica]
MCRVVLCPACDSVDSRAPPIIPLCTTPCAAAVLFFLSLSSSSLTVSATTITIVTSSINHQLRLRLLPHALFLFFLFISSPPSPSFQHIKKRSQFQRKESTFFCQANPPNPRISNQIHILFIFFQCTFNIIIIDSTSSLAFNHSNFFGWL